MKCKHVKQKIDQFLIEDKGPFTKMASQHISECPSCREYYESVLLVSKLSGTLRDNEPTLSSPSLLTENIMLGIKQFPKNKRSETSYSFLTSINFQRFLAAASICFFLVFGYEQYNVLDKITRLEKQNQTIGMRSQIEKANLKGTMEGLLLLKFKLEKKDSETLFKTLSMEHFNNQQLLAAFKQVNLSSKELNQFLGSSFSAIEANNFIENIKSYNFESATSNNFIKN